MKRLPPLDALHVFSVVARESSMSRAAEALCVTQSAVSRQIQQLEAFIGQPLLLRQARGVGLTTAGRQLLPAAEAAFAGIRQAVEGLSARPQDIKIKLPPTFAMRWFLPRLADFQAQHPGIEVRMSTASFSRIHFEREDFDAAIVAGNQGPGEGFGERLFSEQLTPVCAPAMAQRLRRPADLAREALIHLSHDHADWRRWLEAAGVSHPALDAGPSFEVIDMAVNVASQGLGVALADPLLLATDLSSGRLIAPFPALRTPTDYQYWFSCPRGRQQEPALQALLSWLHSEIARSLAANAPQRAP